MTVDQIQYLQYREQVRANRAAERENRRSNRAKETEQHRANVASESNSALRNVIQHEYNTRAINEQTRSNIARERTNQFLASLDAQRNEISREQFQRQYEVGMANVGLGYANVGAQYARIGEEQRSHMANENLNSIIASDNASRNWAQLQFNQTKASDESSRSWRQIGIEQEKNDLALMRYETIDVPNSVVGQALSRSQVAVNQANRTLLQRKSNTEYINAASNATGAASRLISSLRRPN